jgi:hypothetical protein
MSNTALTDVERKQMSGALLGLAKAAQDLIQILNADPTTSGSQADVWLTDSLKWGAGWGAGNPVGVSLLSMWLQAGSGIDHINAFASTLRSSRRPNVSLGTIARGSVEAFSRAYWVLDSTDTGEFLQRAIGAEIADLKHLIALDPSSKVYRGNGKEIAAVKYRDALSAYSSKLPGTIIALPGATKRASDLIAAASSADGRRSYSRLSGAAHGEAFTLGNFTHPLPASFANGREGIYLQITLALAVEYARYMATTAETLCKLLISTYEPKPDVLERWEQASGIAFQRLMLMDASQYESVTKADGSHMKVGRFHPPSL